jgi:hypothetical protein
MAGQEPEPEPGRVGIEPTTLIKRSLLYYYISIYKTVTYVPQTVPQFHDLPLGKALISLVLRMLDGTGGVATFNNLSR